MNDRNFNSHVQRYDNFRTEQMWRETDRQIELQNRAINLELARYHLNNTVDYYIKNDWGQPRRSVYELRSVYFEPSWELFYVKIIAWN